MFFHTCIIRMSNAHKLFFTSSQNSTFSLSGPCMPKILHLGFLAAIKAPMTCLSNVLIVQWFTYRFSVLWPHTVHVNDDDHVYPSSWLYWNNIYLSLSPLSPFPSLFFSFFLSPSLSLLPFLSLSLFLSPPFPDTVISHSND